MKFALLIEHQIEITEIGFEDFFQTDSSKFKDDGRIVYLFQTKIGY